MIIMNKNKKKKMMLICLSVFLLLSLTFFTACSKKEENNQPGTNNNENTDYNKIKLFNKTLNNLNELEATDLQEYLKMVRIVFKEKTYTSFTDEDISVFVAYQLLNNATTSKDKVQELVRKMFNIDNFEVKTGELTSPLGTKIKIIKNGNDYKGNVPLKDIMEKANNYTSFETNKDRVIVNYDYRKLVELNPIDGNKYETLGQTKIYLKYVNGNLVLEKIIYTQK